MGEISKLTGREYHLFNYYGAEDAEDIIIIMGSASETVRTVVEKLNAEGKKVADNVSLAIAPGSKQVFNMLALNGALGDMIAAGARILESACGPCIGMGQSPNSGGISLRTFNRNFEGRSGTADGQIYLVSPETAAVSAINGVFTDPRCLGAAAEIEMPEKFLINDNMVIDPAPVEEMDSVEILRGPNIKSYPETHPLTDSIEASCSLKVGDNITTDHIMPAGAKILPLRSNIPKISEHCFTVCDKEFPTRAKTLGKSIIVGGENYGQGSSREHAALAPLFLGVKAVLVKSFARIHKSNLINAGILPLTFVNAEDYDKIKLGDMLELPNVKEEIANGKQVTVVNKTTGDTIVADCELSDRTKYTNADLRLFEFARHYSTSSISTLGVAPYLPRRYPLRMFSVVRVEKSLMLYNSETPSSLFLSTK